MDPLLRETVEIVDELAALRRRVRELSGRLAELKSVLATDADDGSYTLDAGDAAIVMRVRHTPAFPYRTKEPELFARFDAAARRSRWWPMISEVSHRNARACWRERRTVDPELRGFLADYVCEKRNVTLTLDRPLEHPRTRPTMPA